MYLNRLFIDVGGRAAFAGSPIWLYPDDNLYALNISAFASLQCTLGTSFFYIAAVRITLGIEGSIAYNGTTGYRLLLSARY